MSATILSDKSLKTVSADSPPSPSSRESSLVSSAPSTPPFTPSFAPNADLDVPVPSLVSQLLQPVAEGTTAKDILKGLEMDLDLDRKISDLLREGTKRAHVDAENSQGAVAMVKGELELQEYVRWLAILWRLYDALELGLNEHASDPVLAPIYDPAVLSRSDAISKDIQFLLTRLPASTETSTSSTKIDGPLPPFPLPAFLEPLFADPPGALSVYVTHLRQIASSPRTAPRLLAHAYVRYLGDLSGGQFIAARVKRAYNLEGEDGLRFYHFDLPNRDTGDSKADGRKRAGEVKDWFRRGMDEGVGEDHDLKASLVREANLAFALNTYLFSVIQLPGSQTAQSPAQSAQAPASSASTRIAKLTHPDGTPLRYYERRELERQEEERQRRLHPELVRASTNTWRERIERFCLFSGTVLLGWAVSQYLGPYVSELVGSKTGGVGAEL